MMYGDGRRLPPRNSRGEFRRRRRRDRGMSDYGYDMRRSGDMRYMDSRDYDYLDLVHEKAYSLGDFINRKNNYVFCNNVKRKVKSLFSK